MSDLFSDAQQEIKSTLGRHSGEMEHAFWLRQTAVRVADLYDVNGGDYDLSHRASNGFVYNVEVRNSEWILSVEAVLAEDTLPLSVQVVAEALEPIFARNGWTWYAGPATSALIADDLWSKVSQLWNDQGIESVASSRIRVASSDIVGHISAYLMVYWAYFTESEIYGDL